MKKYKIILKFTTIELEEEISKLMADGWRPQGGPFIAPIRGGVGNLYAQAVVKDE
ncbi:MAG TPA: DUF1737 domain-containing protein [Candidatus Binatia bacterium]|nr:DUF1737 domain-containing protein [Candidatus Binatia bacterium]